MDVLERQLLFVQQRGGVRALVFPSGNVGEIRVIALRLTGLGIAGEHLGVFVEELMFQAEMAAAGFLAVAGVVAHDFGEFEEVRHAAGFFEFHVGILAAAGDADVFPELLADHGDLRQRLAQPFAGPGHAAVVPHHHAQLAVEGIHGAAALDRQQFAGAFAHGGLGFFELGLRGADRARLLLNQIVGDGRRDDEIAVGQPLHECGGPEPVGAVIGEIRFAQHVQAGDVGHEVVIHPQAAHRVMNRRIDHHRQLIGILAGDLLIHLEQVAVARADHRFAEPFGGVPEIQIDAKAGRRDAATVVTRFLGGAGGNVARREVTEGRVFALQIVVAVIFLDIGGIHLLLLQFPGDLLGFRHPNPAIVAEGFGHQGELGLIVAADRDARRMDLRETRIGEQRPALGGPPGGGDVAAHRVGGKEEHVAITAGGQNDRIARMTRYFTGRQIAHNDALGMAVHQHDVQHFRARIHLHAALGDFLFQRLVATDQQLLPGLAAGIKRPGHLRPAERPVVQQATVFAGKRHALRHALVDDRVGHLRQSIDVGFAGAEVAAFDGVVEQSAHGIAVILIVFGGVDAPLGGDRVGAAGAVLVAEALHLIAHLREGGGGGAPGQAGADDDDGEFPLVGRIDELGVHLVLGPFLFKRTGRNFAVGSHGSME